MKYVGDNSPVWTINAASRRIHEPIKYHLRDLSIIHKKQANDSSSRAVVQNSEEFKNVKFKLKEGGEKPSKQNSGIRIVSTGKRERFRGISQSKRFPDKETTLKDSNRTTSLENSYPPGVGQYDLNHTDLSVQNKRLNRGPVFSKVYGNSFASIMNSTPGVGSYKLDQHTIGFNSKRVDGIIFKSRYDDNIDVGSDIGPGHYDTSMDRYKRSVIKEGYKFSIGKSERKYDFLALKSFDQKDSNEYQRYLLTHDDPIEKKPTSRKGTFSRFQIRGESKDQESNRDEGRFKYNTNKSTISNRSAIIRGKNEYNNNNDQIDFPGPGSYNVQSRISNIKFSVPKGKRKDFMIDPTNPKVGPASYHLNIQSNKKGPKIIQTRVEREKKVEEETPGPGSYKLSSVAFNEKAWRFGTSPKGYKVIKTLEKMHSNPAPNTYHPNYSSIWKNSPAVSSKGSRRSSIRKNNIRSETPGVGHYNPYQSTPNEKNRDISSVGTFGRGMRNNLLAIEKENYKFDERNQNTKVGPGTYNIKSSIPQVAFHTEMKMNLDKMTSKMKKNP